MRIMIAQQLTFRKSICFILVLISFSSILLNKVLMIHFFRYFIVELFSKPRNMIYQIKKEVHTMKPRSKVTGLCKVLINLSIVLKLIKLFSNTNIIYYHQLRFKNITLVVSISYYLCNFIKIIK